MAQAVTIAVISNGDPFAGMCTLKEIAMFCVGDGICSDHKQCNGNLMTLGDINDGCGSGPRPVV
jgi:hypothetical protein